MDAYYKSYSWYDSEDYTIIGNGIENTYLESSVSRLAYIDAYSSSSGYVDSNVELSDFTYYPPTYYMGFVYMYYGTSVTMSDIVFDAASYGNS